MRERLSDRVLDSTANSQGTRDLEGAEGLTACTGLSGARLFQLQDGLGFIFGAENGPTGHERVGARCEEFGRISEGYAAVDLDVRIDSALGTDRT